ncbi:MAG: hypothetical protein JOZ47_10900 [Kutzneria sp.]|nr:hypothetical protein [Kutzneria sp.]MBV9845568.1 hypothetical protein [Kutzneria sp.]
MRIVAKNRATLCVVVVLSALAALGTVVAGSKVALSATKAVTAAAALPKPPTRAASAPSARPAAAPCQAPSVTDGLSSQYIVSGGQRRTVLVYFPHGHRTGKPIPVVLDLHGSGDTPQQQLTSTGIEVTAEKQGFAVLAPQGGVPYTLGRTRGFAWNIPGVPLADGRPVPKGAPNDLQFLRDTVSAATKLLCANSRQIYLAGFSGGARMVSQLGCDLADRIAAIAAVSGLRFPSTCRLSRPLPVLSLHGLSDTVNWYNGNQSVRWDYSVPAAARRWADADRCGGSPAQRRLMNLVSATTYSGCAGGVQVELVTIEGGKHAWPGTPGSVVRGLSVPPVNTNDMIWSFFKAHPLGTST